MVNLKSLFWERIALLLILTVVPLRIWVTVVPEGMLLVPFISSVTVCPGEMPSLASSTVRTLLPALEEPVCKVLPETVLSPSLSIVTSLTPTWNTLVSSCTPSPVTLWP